MIALLWLLGAYAQDLPAPILEPNDGASVPWKCKPQPIAGTVAARTVNQARATNEQFYGAANFAERVLFPRLETKPNGTAFEVNVLNGVANVPSRYVGPGCAEDNFNYLNARVDMQSAAVGWAFSLGPVQVFSATSVTSSTYADRLAPLQYLRTTATAISLGYLGPAAMLIGDKNTPTLSRKVDYLLGVQGGLPKIAYGRVAYIGSSGVYAQANGSLVRLMGAVGAKKGGMNYLRAGVDDQPWGFDDERGMRPSTSLFVRQLQLQPVGGGQPSEDFWTGHFRQTNLGGIFDIDAAYSWAPVPLLHVAKAGLHTPGFNAAKKALDTGDDSTMADLLGNQYGFVQAGITGGVVALPELSYYGVQSKQAISWDFEVLAAFGAIDQDAQGFVSLNVGANNPETLAIFPYAFDAIHYNLNLGVGF